MGVNTLERPPSPGRTPSENGGLVRRSEDEVNLALKLVILNGGNLTRTEEQLKEEGFPVHRNILREWRDVQFPRRYTQLRRELGREVNEEVAGRALERAMEADEAEKLYIEQAKSKVEEVDPNHLAKNVLALANAKGQNIEKAQLLRNQPTHRVAVDIEDAVNTLERLGVAKRVDSESETIEDAEVVE